MLLGHIGVALLEHQILDADLAPVLAGTAFPDVLDKLLCQVLRLMPNGRMWGHTALSVGVTTCLVWLVADGRTARSWLVGYLGHLLADLEGPIPWWYPFRTYDFEPSPGLGEIFRRFAKNPAEMLFELGLIGLGLLVLSRRPNARRMPGA